MHLNPGYHNYGFSVVIERYLVFGTHMKKLEYLVDICKGNPKRYGLTGIAFACCLECLHLQIQHSLSTVFSQGEWTLLQVYHHISTLADTLNRIARLVHLDGGVIDNASSEAIQEIRKVGFYIPKGSQLLEMIWNEIIPLDFAVTGATAFYRDLCLGILCHTSIPYLTMLSEWLGLSNKSLITDPAFTDWHDLVDESPIRDPYQEFFLCDIHRTKESLVDRFQPRKEKELPYFLNPMQAGVILRTGNALQLLRRFQPEHPLCCIENISNDFMLHWMPLEAQSHRYIEKLHAFTRLVRQYNENNDSNGRLLVDHDESSMDIEMNQEEEQEDGEETNIQVPTLQALDQDIKLVGDFHKTLDTILLCHQQQQQQDSNNDSDDFLHDHSFIPVVQTITDQSVHQPLALWCPLVNESAMKLFIEKFHIQAHFELIRRFFLFGDDRFSNALAEALFINNNHKRQEQQGAIFVGGIRLHDGGRNSNRMMVKQWPPQTSDLNMSLRAVLLENLAQIPEDIKGYICKPHHPLLDQSLVDLDDLLTFGVREIDPLQQDDRPRWRDPYKIEALDFLYLQYQVPYPLSIIINERTLDKYNRMFTFLLQLQRIDSITKYIHQKLLLQQQPKRSKPPSFFYLQHRIRFQIRQFVNTLNQYVFDTAIHHTWHSFIQRIQHQKKKKENHSQQGEEDYDKEEDEASLFQTMDPIMFGEYHEHVLDRMLYQCFLKKSQQPIKHMLNQVLQDIITLSTTFIFLLDHHYVSTNSTMEECEKQLEQGFQHFMEHTHQFIKVLSKLHDRGIGRLGNVMNSKNLEGSFGVFGDFHDKLDAKRGQGTFAQELLTRLDMNGYYMNYSSSSTTTATTSTTTTPTATSISS
ncbi:gamma-tubulin complex component protein [Phascolomyces articulosus]|uniref:Spindle pole body component n=1 Tax=Phascolomyces articulosus TaxID=60185 RepID=A0AAD5JTQ7_9FUNG|nr:gamma-tubulin complex component protein [Phascolomyces articulosus]